MKANPQVRWRGPSLASVLATVVICAAGVANAAGPETKTIRFVGVPSAGSMIVWIARDRGFFSEEGIELKAANDLAAGLVTDNILGGQAEMVYGGATAMLMPYSKGAPLVSVAHTDRTNLWQLVVHGDSPYRSLEDLKGKTISVIAPNSQCVLALRAVFERNGWPKDFLKFTVVPPPEQVAAFGAKRVDGSCMFDPYRLQMMSQFGGRAIWSIKDANLTGDIGGVLIMHRDFADKNPNTVAAVQRAIGKAADAANKEHELVYAALAGALKRDVAAMRQFAVPSYASPPSLPKELGEMAEALHKYGFVPTPIDVAGFDRSPLAAKK